ncbi:type VI secretion system baseplate subunit TssK [Paraburkholderia fungorum]|uniref:type VI secretion system baseplate subunit TssK n=1 Tax=Paraburkholderia fungorum TaxID=134537 RepID=UPI002093E645|nr:type VI secretion system baseplate subunit TssK [Paraburkholderia fungorum]USU14968.1 type VI secretion system baseplate subunit TssK [Paraburkholderia fungorum]USU22916.1 type VI secretion system baseplate subunit TssK [Paraburkholderia fungorum]
MSWNNKVIWSEGMFLQPQHLQQHDRYLHALVESRAAGLRPYGWGFTALRLDDAQLALGKLAILECAGVLPDGTPFALSADDAPPPGIDIPDDARNALVVLALPVRRPGIPEATAAPSTDSFARYGTLEYEVNDSNSDGTGAALLQIGKLRLRLAFESEVVNAHACLGVARVIERRADNRVVLDSDYAPPCLDFRVAPRLAAFADEFTGLLRQRGEALASRLSAPGTGGAAEIQDFLLLQLVNRAEPLIAHLATMTGLHPEELFRVAVALAGELATFSQANKRTAQYPVYRHDRLAETFMPVIADLRQSLSMVMDSAVVPIPLDARKFGVHVAVVPDTELYKSAMFVLAVNAQMPAETVRNSFAQQAKIGPVEKIRDLVNLQLPGIALRALPVAPRQLPFHAGFTYFELDRSNELWKLLPTSAGFAMHVAGEFPGLQLTFWAIRR